MLYCVSFRQDKKARKPETKPTKDIRVGERPACTFLECAIVTTAGDVRPGALSYVRVCSQTYVNTMSVQLSVSNSFIRYLLANSKCWHSLDTVVIVQLDPDTPCETLQ